MKEPQRTHVKRKCSMPPLLLTMIGFIVDFFSKTWIFIVMWHMWKWYRGRAVNLVNALCLMNTTLKARHIGSAWPNTLLFHAWSVPHVLILMWMKEKKMHVTSWHYLVWPDVLEEVRAQTRWLYLVPPWHQAQMGWRGFAQLGRHAEHNWKWKHGRLTPRSGSWRSFPFCVIARHFDAKKVWSILLM